MKASMTASTTSLQTAGSRKAVAWTKTGTTTVGPIEVVTTGAGHTLARTVVGTPRGRPRVMGLLSSTRWPRRCRKRKTRRL